MHRKFLLLIIVYLFILSGLILFQGNLLLLAVPIIIYISLGIIAGPHVVKLEIKRVVEPERVLPGTPISVRLTVKNIASKACTISLHDFTGEGLEIVSGDPQLLALISPGTAVDLNYTVRGMRGIYTFNHLVVTSLGDDALFEDETSFAVRGQVFILPHVPPIRRMNLRTWQTKVYAGNIPARVAGSGTDFFSVRNYQPGDSLRHINWRNSARNPDTLYTNEFERERVTEIWLILDGRERSNLKLVGDELFEHVILSGAGLAQALLKEGNRVGLLIYGGYLRWTFPGYGKVQLEKMLRSLAQARTGDLFIFSDLENLPTRAFPFSSLLILISPLHAEDVPILLNLRGRGYTILVVSPDPVKFEYSRLAREKGGLAGLRIAKIERQYHLARLQNAGIRVVNWDVSVPFERTVQAALIHPLRTAHPVRPM